MIRDSKKQLLNDNFLDEQKTPDTFDSEFGNRVKCNVMYRLIKIVQMFPLWLLEFFKTQIYLTFGLM